MELHRLHDLSGLWKIRNSYKHLYAPLSLASPAQLWVTRTKQALINSLGQIGAIMYEIGRCDHPETDNGPKDTPEQWAPFLPPFPIHGAPAAGATFGVNIGNMSYSSHLKETILACLYEIPANRPTLPQLKVHIANAIADLLAAPPPASTPDSFGDLRWP